MIGSLLEASFVVVAAAGRSRVGTEDATWLLDRLFSALALILLIDQIVVVFHTHLLALAGRATLNTKDVA